MNEQTTTAKDFTAARVAYEGYCRQTGWKSLATGQDLPEFDGLPQEIKEAWSASANHLLRTTINLPPDPKHQSQFYGGGYEHGILTYPKSTIKELSQKIYDNARAKGFYAEYDELIAHPQLTAEQKDFIRTIWFGTRMMLIVSEAADGSALDVAHQPLRHVALVVHVGEFLLERPAAVVALVPLPPYTNADTLSLVGRVHEQLLLDSVLLQPWVHNATPDTNGGSDDVLGWNDHVVFVLHSAQWIPAVHSEKVGQANKVATSDFGVPVLGGLYGY